MDSLPLNIDFAFLFLYQFFTQMIYTLTHDDDDDDHVDKIAWD